MHVQLYDLECVHSERLCAPNVGSREADSKCDVFKPVPLLLCYTTLFKPVRWPSLSRKGRGSSDQGRRRFRKQVMYEGQFSGSIDESVWSSVGHRIEQVGCEQLSQTHRTRGSTKSH